MRDVYALRVVAHEAEPSGHRERRRSGPCASGDHELGGTNWTWCRLGFELSEAVGDACADQPRIELGFARDVRAADHCVKFRLEKQLLDVEIDAPMLI